MAKSVAKTQISGSAFVNLTILEVNETFFREVSIGFDKIRSLFTNFQASTIDSCLDKEWCKTGNHMPPTDDVGNGKNMDLITTPCGLKGIDW